MKRLVPFVVPLLLCAAAGVAMAEDPPAAPAAPETPFDRFRASLERIGGNVRRSNETVRTVLATLDWNAWNRAHDSYVRTLDRAMGEMESAISNYMIGVLDSGATMDSPVLEAIDKGCEAAGLIARHKTRIGSYATLTRRRVRPEKRRDALDYLSTLGVYDLGDKLNDATGRVLAPTSTANVGRAPASGGGSLGESPVAGRIPGTPEAGEALRNWQVAYMQAQSNLQRIAALECQLESLPAASRGRPMAEEQLADARAKQDQLVASIEEWRRKYFEAGGR